MKYPDLYLCSKNTKIIAVYKV